MLHTGKEDDCICALSILYKSGSTSISTAEQGLFRSKFAKTEGCSIPIDPITISLDEVLGVESGRADLSVEAIVSRADAPVFTGSEGVGSAGCKDGLGRRWIVAPLPGR